ncbi:MAG: DUF4339 domain-containing protein [Prosthecobacter sp.]
MKWYFNNAGAAEGPHDDNAMMTMAREKKIAADSLVWHPGLDSWQSVTALSPSWWGDQKPKPTVKTTTSSKEKTADSGGGARRLGGPMAPTTEASEQSSGGGLLKRLFGFGRKK